MIAWVAVSITSTPPTPGLTKYPTYAWEPSGENATGSGIEPTGIVAVTVFVAVSSTDTLLLPLLVT